MIGANRVVSATAVAILALLFEAVAAEGYLQEGFGRFGRYNDDGLLTADIWPDRATVPGLTIRHAPASVIATVSSIDTTAKTLNLAGGGAGDATSVRSILLYPGYTATFGNEARLRLSRDTLTVEPLMSGDRRGLLLRATSGTMAPVGLAFADGVDPDWQLLDLGSTAELVLTSTVPLGEIRVFTPNGIKSLSASPGAGVLQGLRSTAAEWVGRSAPTMTDRQVAVDFDAGTVRVTETFSSPGGGSPIAPVPPVLAFAISKGYPATVEGTLLRSGFATRYGEFAWVEGDTLVYTLPIPPMDERGLLRPTERTEEVTLLNAMADRMGASWAVNAVDLAYAGMAPAQMAWMSLDGSKRTALTNAWSTYLPFAFRLPPYEPTDNRKTWIRETEPLSGLDYWYTYYITGGPGEAYKLDIEWGNLLPLYGLQKYAQYSGDWDAVTSRWSIVRQLTTFTDYADDWAWMTNANGDMGWSTGTGDPMTAAYVGHMAALRMARAIGDEEAAKHYAYRASRVAVPAVARFWYKDWAREQGLIPQNHIVQGFWEKSTFTSTAMSETATDPWGPTNPLSGNGCQHEFFAALMRFAPDALRDFEDEMLIGYPNLFNPDHVYTTSTTYGGNSVYVTFPHLYARTWLGEPTNELWTLLNRAQSNRRTTGWVAPNVIAELLARDTPLILTEWQPLRWREGNMASPGIAYLSFTSPVRRRWTLRADLTTSIPVQSVTIAGTEVPFTATDGKLVVTADVQGNFDVVVRFQGATCATEVIVDNDSSARFVTEGPWTASANPPLVGTNSLFSYGGAPANKATWTPDLECSGLYDVYTTWVAAANRTTTATYQVNHSTGSASVVLNQQAQGNRWNLLGRYTFAAGTAGSVVLTDAGVATDAIVSADAVRFVLVEERRESEGWMMQ